MTHWRPQPARSRRCARPWIIWNISVPANPCRLIDRDLNPHQDPDLAKPLIQACPQLMTRAIPSPQGNVRRTTPTPACSLPQVVRFLPSLSNFERGRIWSFLSEFGFWPERDKAVPPFNNT